MSTRDVGGDGPTSDSGGTGTTGDAAPRLGAAGDDATAPRTEGPRITPGGRREVGLPVWALGHVAGRAMGTAPPAVFLTLGRHRRLFRGWLHFAGRLMPGGLLPRRETELVILRVAHRAGSDYEFEHHVRLGARAGIDAAQVDRVREGPGATGWTLRERTLLATADALHERRDLDDVEWAALREHLDEREAIELLLLIGHYEMLATTLTVLRVEPDAPRRRRRP